MYDAAGRRPNCEKRGGHGCQNYIDLVAGGNSPVSARIVCGPFETHAQSTPAVRGEVTFHDNRVTRADGLTFQVDSAGTHAFWLYARLGPSGTPENESAQRIPIENIKTIAITTQRSAIRTSVTLRDGRILDGWNWLTDTVTIHEKFPLPTPHQLSTIRKITLN